MKQLTFILLLTFLTQFTFGQDITAKEIIRKAEEKTRGKKSAYSEMTIKIVRKKWSREMSMKSWSMGNDYSLILVTAPAKEKGTVFLKREKEVWNWMPTIERTIKLPPSMMGQSWMGTDLTNDDLVKESSTVEDYNHKILKDTVIDGRTCWKLELIPKEGVAVVWGKILAYIDQTDFIQLRTEMYDEDDYLINVMNSSEIKELGGVMMATRMEFIPVEKEGQKTIMTFNVMEFDIDINEDFFTTQNMRRVN